MSAFACPRCTLLHPAPTPPTLWRCTICNAPRHPRLLVHAEDLPRLVSSLLRRTMNLAPLVMSTPESSNSCINKLTLGWTTARRYFSFFLF
jgi:hypothetical protein